MRCHSKEDKAGAKKVISLHTTPLPLDITCSEEDCNADEEAARQLEQEHNIDYDLCIGSLIYLEMTRYNIVIAVNKLAKFSKHPVREHFEALLHSLRYLRDTTNPGIKFYHYHLESPITKMLIAENIHNLILSLASCIPCGTIMWMVLHHHLTGGIMDHSSKLLDPVTMSSAETEYSCIIFMATSH